MRSTLDVSDRTTDYGAWGSDAIDPTWRTAMLSKTLQESMRHLPPADRELARRVLDEQIRAGAGDRALTLVAQGLSHLGKTKEGTGLDCSGFVRHLFRQNGEPLEPQIRPLGPNGCTQMIRSFGAIEADEAVTGDLVFFDYGTDPAKEANHVGVLLVHEDGSRSVLHMSDHGVKLSPLFTAGGKPAYWGTMNPRYARPPSAE